MEDGMNGRFRKATEHDLAGMEEILKDAIRFLKEQKIDQWQRGYPDREQLIKDIRAKCSYVIEEKDGPKAMCAVSFDSEKSYERIEGGAWLTKGEDHAIVHRFAVHSSCKGKGMASFPLGDIDKLAQKEGVFSIRIDTHEDNVRMQHVLERAGYQKCGVIRLIGGSEDGVPRLAYEKVLENFGKKC